MLTTDNTISLIAALNRELKKLHERRTLFVCGGAALLMMKIIDRSTRDIDVISPELDLTLKRVSARIAEEFGLADNWLNNGPTSLARDLNPGWEKRCISVFKDGFLEVRVLGREDLLSSKVFAFCDREDDFQDVLLMKPSTAELEKIKPWVLRRDASPYWPKRVQDCFERLLEEQVHE